MWICPGVCIGNVHRIRLNYTESHKAALIHCHNLLDLRRPAITAQWITGHFYCMIYARMYSTVPSAGETRETVHANPTSCITRVYVLSRDERLFLHPRLLATPFLSCVISVGNFSFSPNGGGARRQSQLRMYARVWCFFRRIKVLILSNAVQASDISHTRVSSTLLRK